MPTYSIQGRCLGQIIELSLHKHSQTTQQRVLESLHSRYKIFKSAVEEPKSSNLRDPSLSIKSVEECFMQVQRTKSFTDLSPIHSPTIFSVQSRKITSFYFCPTITGTWNRLKKMLFEGVHGCPHLPQLSCQRICIDAFRFFLHAESIGPANGSHSVKEWPPFCICSFKEIFPPTWPLNLKRGPDPDRVVRTQSSYPAIVQDLLPIERTDTMVNLSRKANPEGNPQIENGNPKHSAPWRAMHPGHNTKDAVDPFKGKSMYHT